MRWYTAPTRGVRMIFDAGPEYQFNGFDMQFKCERRSWYHLPNYRLLQAQYGKKCDIVFYRLVLS